MAAMTNQKMWVTAGAVPSSQNPTIPPAGVRTLTCGPFRRSKETYTKKQFGEGGGEKINKFTRGGNTVCEDWEIGALLTSRPKWGWGVGSIKPLPEKQGIGPRILRIQGFLNGKKGDRTSVPCDPCPTFKPRNGGHRGRFWGLCHFISRTPGD